VYAHDSYRLKICPRITQQVFGKEQTGIHHAEPFAVKVSAVLAVLAEQAFFHQKAFFVLIADAFQVIFFFLAESIGVNKAVAACVVRRVNNDALHLAVICLLKRLQHFQTFAFNKEVFRGVKVDGFFRSGFQSSSSGLLQDSKGITLACPIQYISLIGKIDILAKSGFQLFPIQLVLGKEFRKKLFQPLQPGLLNIY
jgi:hypothetical protein